MTARLQATFLTLFPESLASVLDASMLGRARKSGVVQTDAIDLRQFSPNKHGTVDDTPCGGGPGMVLRVDVAVAGIRAAQAADDARGEGRTRRVLWLDAAGTPFTQADAERLAAYDHLVLLCGRYEGIDARVRDHVDEVVSIGDYVLTGGELPALVVVDAVARLLPGVLGNAASREEESHVNGTLEHRQYTRPVAFEGRAVPSVLLSGDHARIAKARRRDVLLRTRALRPDLYARQRLDAKDTRLLDDARVASLDPESSASTPSPGLDVGRDRA